MKSALPFFSTLGTTLLFSMSSFARYCPTDEVSIQVYGGHAFNVQKQIDVKTGSPICTYQVAYDMTPQPPQENPECPLDREDVARLTLIDQHCSIQENTPVSGVISLKNGVARLD